MTTTAAVTTPAVVIREFPGWSGMNHRAAVSAGENAGPMAADPGLRSLTLLTTRRIMGRDGNG